MTDDQAGKRKCLGSNCQREASNLQCPTCLKLSIANSYYCSQDCFKTDWATHKSIHKQQTSTGIFNPFPNFAFTGVLRPVYPLSPKRVTPQSIRLPDYAKEGVPRSEKGVWRTNKIQILDSKAQEAMRKVCRLAREVLDIAAAAIRPGISTDELDEIVHNACIERNSYPSPLNYNGFPKSFCTSINEVICHGIPDKRILLDSDIINLDVSLYHEGYHGDVNETYYVSDTARADPDSVRVVETARECLDEAIKLVKPGTLIREFGKAIEAHAKRNKCDVVRAYVGHGVNTEFHPPPNIPHYAKNKAVGECKSGMAFTIEPMITLGNHRDVTWPDNWTSVTVDGRRSAQFGKFICTKYSRTTCIGEFPC